ncbi:hypothetical protein [Paenibacillus sp. FSL K6-2859]|uniref:hypothetical protein n=1 Tax=Paenibacillus sp. FSL K6-2859 TaxID=2921482 RepID=UPI0030FB18B3
MILRLNGVALPDIGGGVVDNITETVTGIVSRVLGDTAHGIIAAMNAYSPEIITFGIVICALGMMVGPIVGNNGKWMGRMFLTFWVGVIWRVLT